MGMRISSCITVLFLLGACSGDPEDTSLDADQTNQTGTIDGSDDSGDTGAGGLTEDALSYYSHIQPIMQTYCTRCHRENGMGVGDFNDPEMVKLFADIMMARIDDGSMPPPVSDPSCNDYEGSERMSMSEEDKETFRAWIGAGKPLGDFERQVEVPEIRDELNNPDLEVRIAHPYTPLFLDEDNPANEYRCFVVETGRDDTFYVTGIHPIVDQPALVHHIVLFKQNKGKFGDAYDPETGIDCINNTSSAGRGMISGWAPGMVPVEFPDGSGIEIKPDEELVVQMHYFLPGPQWEGVADQSGYAFETAEADEIDTKLVMLPLGGTNFRIPAGDEDYGFTDSLTLPVFAPTITLYATFPHMHILGRSYRFWITNADGEETCLAASEKWNFDNQLTYVFKEPVELRGGDTIHMECRWNNSRSNPNLIHDPPIEVGYGERTDEEMCWAFTLLHSPIEF